MRYSEIRGQVEPFDIILFSGKGFISRAIQAVTGSHYSHVGLAVRLPDYDLNLLYESTTLSSIPDLTTGARVKGVQLVTLSDRVRDYEGSVFWRHLSGPREEGILRTAQSFVSKFAGRPYETNQLELIKSALDLTHRGQNQPDASSVFCSELSAYLLREVSILGGKNPENEFTPADFAGDLPLNNDYTPAEVVRIN